MSGSSAKKLFAVEERPGSSDENAATNTACTESAAWARDARRNDGQARPGKVVLVRGFGDERETHRLAIVVEFEMDGTLREERGLVLREVGREFPAGRQHCFIVVVGRSAAKAEITRGQILQGRSVVRKEVE